MGIPYLSVHLYLSILSHIDLSSIWSPILSSFIFKSGQFASGGSRNSQNCSVARHIFPRVKLPLKSWESFHWTIDQSSIWSTTLGSVSWKFTPLQWRIQDIPDWVLYGLSMVCHMFTIFEVCVEYLPPTYEVRGEGNIFTLSVYREGGGVPQSQDFPRSLVPGPFNFKSLFNLDSYCGKRCQKRWNSDHFFAQSAARHTSFDSRGLLVSWTLATLFSRR